jgi:hypothetical protein
LIDEIEDEMRDLIGTFDNDDGISIPFQTILSFPPIFSDIPHTQYLLESFSSLELIWFKERERKDEVLIYMKIGSQDGSGVGSDIHKGGIRMIEFSLWMKLGNWELLIFYFIYF